MPGSCFSLTATLFTDDDLVVLAPGKTASLEVAPVPIDAFDVKVLEVLQAGEAAKAFAAFPL